MKYVKNALLILFMMLLLIGCSQDPAKDSSNEIDMSGFTKLDHELFSPGIQGGAC